MDSLKERAKATEESERQIEVLGNVVKDKEGDISTLMKQVLQAKEDRKTKFRNSDTFFYKLSGTFANGFNDCFCQVKASFLDEDLSQISIDSAAQTPVRTVESEGTDELFEDDFPPNAQDDGEATPQDDQVKSVEDETHPLEEAKTVDKEKDEEAVVDQPQF